MLCNNDYFYIVNGTNNKVDLFEGSNIINIISAQEGSKIVLYNIH